MTDDKKDQFHANEHGVLLHNTIEKSGENIRTIFSYGADIDSLIDLAKEKSIKVKSIESETDEEGRYNDVENVYEIYSGKCTAVVGLTYYRRVMIVRAHKDDALIEEWLENVDDTAVINHGKEEFSIMGDKYCPTCHQEIKERTKIIAKSTTLDSAVYAQDAELVPGTDYEFYLDKKLIAQFTMYYLNSEMDDVNPTIEDFEVNNESYKEIIVRGIEERVERQGFEKIWLTNYIGYPPETDFWMKMEYAFDIDEGYKELY